MEKQYDHGRVENSIYDRWQEKKYFNADPNSERPPYSIVIPPPNVTGSLHMGHALNNTVQDILIRYKRMDGFETLWVPGTDHAGIATQNVVEKKLAKEGKTRYDVGREAFVKEVWKWTDEYHSRITTQLKKLGMSCDWDKERFTLDEGLSQAVRKVFIALYKDGLIYRGKRIINWCPRCRTALSDEEAEHKQVNGKLWYLRYPLKDACGFITVATTRPETMLGDVAVAVNPSDSRYQSLHGANVLLPLVNRLIPVIVDPFVDKEFGTGAVKVTPAHDPNDFAMSQRHGLEPIVVMSESATMQGAIPEQYIGLDRMKARAMIVEDLQKLGLIEKIEEHTHAVGHCYRCATTVEPYYSNQWFVKMEPLARKALQAAHDNTIHFYPNRYRKTYIDWMENIRDWCISRQIWWGHRIPVWYCDSCGEVIVDHATPTSCPKCNATTLAQDEDVLDTWFSSWLWPFSTMGWPEKTPLLDKFYPTNVLVTAPEILFFWVARMIMASLYCNGKLPFVDIMLHGTVRDKTGRKMSKSLGNSIDPLDVIKQYGTDALRFSLIMTTAQGSDVYLSQDTFEMGRNFANKLWNASRFVLTNIETSLAFSGLPKTANRKPEDVWILSKLQTTITATRDAIENFRLNEACHCIYDFAWHDFCDWYIEAKKIDLYSAENAVKQNGINLCVYVLTNILKLLHPIMPFISEEIWNHVCTVVSYPKLLDHESIMMSVYPKTDIALVAREAEERFELLKEFVTAIRTIRSENNIPPDKKGSVIIVPQEQFLEQYLLQQKELICAFARLAEVTISCTAQKPKFAGQAVVRGTSLFLEFHGLIDQTLEIERLTKEINHFSGLAEATAQRLGSGDFIKRAPSQVVEKEKQKYEGILLNLEKLRKSLANLTE
ncbi:MAG: valine--tRNA ligase [Chitinivibrionales bacterium]|nr:valine--tRNA ligase [Chitinivibrionales bacterium]